MPCRSCTCSVCGAGEHLYTSNHKMKRSIYYQAENTSLVKALYDYEANAPGELTVKEDDMLLVFGQEDAWLVVQSQAEGGKAGYVPENYCEVRNF